MIRYIISSPTIHYYFFHNIIISGLGTSTSAEAKEYFSNLQTHEIDFMWDEKVL